MEKPPATVVEPTSEPKTIDRMPSLLTVDEAARFFRINRNTLYEAIKLNQVPGIVRIGKTIRLGRDAVKRWIRGQSRG